LSTEGTGAESTVSSAVLLGVIREAGETAHRRNQMTTLRKKIMILNLYISTTKTITMIMTTCLTMMPRLFQEFQTMQSSPVSTPQEVLKGWQLEPVR
jgi:hypothetical protein